MSLKHRFAIVVLLAPVACTRQTTRQAPPAESGGAIIHTAPSTEAPRAAAPTPTPPAQPVACASDMTEVAGNYCTNLWHWCLEGYPTIGSQWTKYHPNGVPGVEYCEKYVVGKAECKGAERPLRFCIDQYEYPGKDELPRVMVTWYEAERLCKERGKRLCDDDEWTLACEGADRLPYPYGWERDETACNIGKRLPPNRSNEKLYSKDPAVAAAELARLDLRVPSGSMPRCVSPFGVYDMTGNADEWARNVTMRGQPFVSLFKGGHMLGKVRNRCRPSTTAHGPEFYYHVEGFRCCANAK